MATALVTWCSKTFMKQPSSEDSLLPIYCCISVAVFHYFSYHPHSFSFLPSTDPQMGYRAKWKFNSNLSLSKCSMSQWNFYKKPFKRRWLLLNQYLYVSCDITEGVRYLITKYTELLVQSISTLVSLKRWINELTKTNKILFICFSFQYCLLKTGITAVDYYLNILQEATPIELININIVTRSYSE